MALMMVTALMWCGCGGSGDEPGGEPTPQPNEKAIAFSGGLTEESVTRAGDVGLENYYTRFKVWGFKNDASTVHIVMNGYTVNWINNSANTTASNSSGWEYVNQQGFGQMEQSIKYWDYDATAYRFFGVAGTSETNTISGAYKPNASNPERYELTYRSDATNPSATPYYSHLWLGGSEKYGQPVRLEFIKPLSKVRFMFIFEDPSKASTTELTDKSFCPTNGNTIKTKGDVCISYPLTGNASETFAATVEAEGMSDFKLDYYASVRYDENDPPKVIDPYLGADAGKTGQEYNVLPVSGQGSYTLTVRVNGEPKTTVVPAEFMEWKPGYQYTYIFKIHVDEGVSISSVQSAFTTWIPHDTDRTVYNW